MERHAKMQTTWWQWAIGINIFFVVMTTVAPYLPESGTIAFFFRAFNLALEMNVAAWWSGVFLLVTALLAYELYSTDAEQNRVSWLILATILAGLSLDEIGSLHERAGGWSNIIPIGAVGALLLLYALVSLYRNQNTRPAALMVLAAFGLFGTVAIQERLEHAVQWPFWMTGIRAGVEEGVELLAIGLILAALVQQRQRQNSLIGLSAVIPNPFRFQYLSMITIGGLILHLFLSFSVEYYAEIGRRGNPAVWYPTAIFFLLASVCFWKRSSIGYQWNRRLLFLSNFFIVASISTMYAVSPRVEASMLSIFEMSTIFYVWTLGLTILPTLLGKPFDTFRPRNFLLLLTLVIGVAVGFAMEGILPTYLIRYILVGTISYGVTSIFLHVQAHVASYRSIYRSVPQ